MPQDPPPEPLPSDITPAYETPELERPASATPTEPILEYEARPAPHDPYAALRIPAARNYLLGNFLSILGTQMLSVAVGYEIYRRTGSMTGLGLLGLVQALPIILFAMPAGQLADSFNRKRIVLCTQTLIALCSLALAAVSFFSAAIPNHPLLAHTNAALQAADHYLQHLLYRTPTSHFTDPAIPLMYFILLLNGVGRAFNDPAKSSLLPRLVPLPLLSSAITWGSTSFQTASVVGPAIGGFLAAVSLPLVYTIDAFGHLVLVAFLLTIPNPPQTKPTEKLSLRTLAGGIRFVWQQQIILATITLDLFAVLLGGAVALLPVYADYLHVGPIGLGFMRAAPSVGALLMALYLAHRPPMKKAGRDLLWAVIGFGLATIIFGLTAYPPLCSDLPVPYLNLPWRMVVGFPVALAMLFATGALDNISVVVRHTLVQVLTPDTMRGRVSAVNNVFIGASNELGAFESGITAAVFTAPLSVIGGGIGTILVVAACAIIWPQLRTFGSLAEAQPIDESRPKANTQP